MNRRFFLKNAGVAFGSAAFAPALVTAGSSDYQSVPPASRVLDTWAKVRGDFLLDHKHLQMSQMLLASHPTVVREAIARHRKGMDENPATYWEDHWIEAEEAVIKAAAEYTGADPSELGLTDSTTQGVSLLLNGFKLKPGEEVLATTHDHYITEMSIKYACQKKGASHRHIDVYKDPSTATVDEIVGRITKAIAPRTRLLVVTWVHSCSGMKLPIRAIADAVADVNAKRSEEDRLYFMVDGVHGFGNQAEQVVDLGCDFFAAGTHKWIFGPRGTGIVYGKKDAWHMIEPTIPTFRWNPFMEWMDLPPEGEMTFTDKMCPGGFHAFEHRYSLKEAFEYQTDLGRANVHARTTSLNSQLKEGLSQMKHVKVLTPMDPGLSAGINCMVIGDLSAEDAVKAFHDKGVIASASPYKVSYVRLTPCIINTEAEVDQCIDIVSSMSA